MIYHFQLLGQFSTVFWQFNQQSWTHSCASLIYWWFLCMGRWGSMNRPKIGTYSKNFSPASSPVAPSSSFFDSEESALEVRQGCSQRSNNQSFGHNCGRSVWPQEPYKCESTLLEWDCATCSSAADMMTFKRAVDFGRLNQSQHLNESTFSYFVNSSIPPDSITAATVLNSVF